MTARSDELLIGVDLGTSVVKAALYGPDGVALATAEQATTLRQPAPGVAEQDPDEFVTAALAVIREVVDASGCAPGSVAAVAFAGQMGGLLAIDAEWQAITPWYVSTLDTRYVPYVARMEAQAGPAMIALGGAVPIAGPRMLWWQEAHPAARCAHRQGADPGQLRGRAAGRVDGRAGLRRPVLSHVVRSQRHGQPHVGAGTHRAGGIRTRRSCRASCRRRHGSVRFRRQRQRRADCAPVLR